MILSVSLSFFFSLSHFARLSLLLSQQLFFTRLTLGNGMCIYELISIRWFFEIEKGNSLICAQRRNIDALNGLPIFQKYCIPVNGIKKHMPKLLKRVRKWQKWRVWWSTEATNISVYVVFRMVFPFQERSWNGFSNKNCHNENGAYNEKLKWMKYKYMILSFATFNRRLKMS